MHYKLEPHNLKLVRGNSNENSGGKIARYALSLCCLDIFLPKTVQGVYKVKSIKCYNKLLENRKEPATQVTFASRQGWDPLQVFAA